MNPADRASPPRAAQIAELHVPTPEGLKALREKAQAVENPGGVATSNAGTIHPLPVHFYAA